MDTETEPVVEPTVIGRDMAVFTGSAPKRRKQWTKVVVTVAGDKLKVIRPGVFEYEYDIVETVKAGMAWDVAQGESRLRIVAQNGCGCGGMRRYAADPGYSGALPV